MIQKISAQDSETLDFDASYFFIKNLKDSEGTLIPSQQVFFLRDPPPKGLPAFPPPRGTKPSIARAPELRWR